MDIPLAVLAPKVLKLHSLNFTYGKKNILVLISTTCIANSLADRLLGFLSMTLIALVGYEF